MLIGSRVVSQRETGLGPMPDFGYLRDRARLDEMRALAVPGGRAVFIASWKRWIYTQRYVT